MQQSAFSKLPSVDEILKSGPAAEWLSDFPRTTVLRAIRETLAEKRGEIRKGAAVAIDPDSLGREILAKIRQLSSYSLVPVVNATGIVVHTNLGRAVLSERALANVIAAGRGYSNLEYDLKTGTRGKRHSHTRALLTGITGAEDAFIVNNNAAAVLLCLNTLARGREVIVSRGELVEIGGSFRVPDVMSASGATLREVGTTNKTHLRDYAAAINENTALILKVHQSNYKIIGFTSDVGVSELAALGKKAGLPVMYDLGSGCLLDLKPYGIFDEPTVQDTVSSGVDIVTFSGDKLLGGPQGGIIAGKRELIERIQKNPLARALRIDKLTIAAFEAVLMDYMDPETARKSVPVLAMLFQPKEEIRARARRLASRLSRSLGDAEVTIVEDMSQAGGGSLPETSFATFAVSVRSPKLSVNELERRLRRAKIPVIARIKADALLLDARTIRDSEIGIVAEALEAALSE